MAHFHEGDILLIQNEISLSEIMEEAHRQGIRIAFNPSPYNANITELPLSYVQWFFINETESWQLPGKSDPQDITNTLLNRYPDSSIVLTLGEKGVLIKIMTNKFSILFLIWPW